MLFLPLSLYFICFREFKNIIILPWKSCFDVVINEIVLLSNENIFLNPNLRIYLKPILKPNYNKLKLT